MKGAGKRLLRAGFFKLDLLKRWRDDERGLSAIEFAMLLPLLLVLFLGSVDLSQGISADRKLTYTTKTVADLVSRTTSLTASEMNDVLAAATAVMAPFPAGNLRLIVSSVEIDKDGNATIDWSTTLNGTAHNKGDPVTLPDALLANKSSSLIWSEAQYLYQPVVGYVIVGQLTLSDQICMSPRKSIDVKYTP
ncbi:MAG: pilus assembly protein [Rhizobiales bacterium]|nr:pilus assembly protein [Hyphomicrobiales bacterium]